MKLATAARFFDRQRTYDAYSGLFAFSSQLDTYDDAKRDGLSEVRRIMSVAPGTAIPSRRCVEVAGQYWMVSSYPEKDAYNGGVIREKYILHRADESVQYSNINGLLSTSGRVTAYTSFLWTKGVREVDESSDMINRYEAYFSWQEDVNPGHIISTSSKHYFIRAVHTTTSGFLACEVDEMEQDCFGSAQYTIRTYVPVTDSYTQVTVNAPSLLLRWQNYYEFLSEGSAKFVEGDDVVMVRQSDVALVKSGDLITFSGVVYRVVASRLINQVWYAHVSRQ